MAARRSSKKSTGNSPDSKAKPTAAADPATTESLAAHLGRVHHQDCIAGMESLPAGSVDLVFADPPFNIGYAYDVYHDNKGYQEYLDWSTAWIRGVHRVLKDDGTFWLAIGDEYAAELKLIAQREVGFHIRSWVVWYYTFGVNCKTKFSRSHAHLFHFVKDPQKFTFRSADLENRIPSARQLVYGDGRANPDGRLPDDTWILRPQDLAGHFTPEEDTWYFPRVAGTFKERAGFHGCQMPEQLLGRIIRSCSQEGEVVLDPFSGSATTLVVAKKLGRNHLGFDLSPDYVKRGTDRLANVFLGDALEGAPEPTMSAPATKPKERSCDLSPLEVAMLNTAEAQAEKAGTQIDTAIVEAFSRVSRGFSVDRLVADPELNLEFAGQCEQLGLFGDIRNWNRRLLRLRKSGRYPQTKSTQRFELSWEECDNFLFASEIAWKSLLDRGVSSLDEILCDPESAKEFDQFAALLAPGYTSLQYRWGALKLRKASSEARERSERLAEGRFSAPQKIGSSGNVNVPTAAGIYLVEKRGQSHPLYVGEALNLRQRLDLQFDVFENHDRKAFWGSGLSVSFFPAEPKASLLLAYQALCISKHKPQFNLPEVVSA
jgi:DNA modification methylase